MAKTAKADKAKTKVEKTAKPATATNTWKVGDVVTARAWNPGVADFQSLSGPVVKISGNRITVNDKTYGERSVYASQAKAA